MFDRNNYKLGGDENVFLNIKQIKETAKDPSKCTYYNGTKGIPLEYSYRPDLIASDLYNGDVTMADYIAILNDIDDSPEGFYAGRKLIVLKSEYIEEI